MSSASTDRLRDCLTDPVLRLLCVDAGAIVACEAGFADVAAIAGHGDHALASVIDRWESDIMVAEGVR